MYYHYTHHYTKARDSVFVTILVEVAESSSILR